MSLTVTLIAMAAYRSAGLSLVPDFVYEPDRGRANSIANLVSVAFTAVGIVLAMAFMPLKAAKTHNFADLSCGCRQQPYNGCRILVHFQRKRVTDDFNRRLEEYKRDYPENTKAKPSLWKNLTSSR